MLELLIIVGGGITLGILALGIPAYFYFAGGDDPSPFEIDEEEDL